MSETWVIFAALLLNGKVRTVTPAVEFDRAGCERAALDICAREPGSVAICFRPDGLDQNVVCHAPLGTKTASK